MARQEEHGEDGVYVTLDELTRLQHRARGFSFLPSQPVHSLLSGRRASRLRGRGLDFEELRGYLPGDDPRSIDWKVTARTGTPYVRVNTEERDRPVLLVVDQRLSMFFGSIRCMKSVAAARLAAAAAWRTTAVGDRIGAVVFDDRTVERIRPHRSTATVLRILHAIVEKNRALRADRTDEPSPAQLDETLRSVEGIVKHDWLVVVISDFDGVSDDTTGILARLAQRNDVLAVPVFDPASRELPPAGRLVAGDGELQVEVDLGRRSTRQAVLEQTGARLDRILAWRREIGVPVVPITTAEDELEQVRRLLGSTAGGR